MSHDIFVSLEVLQDVSKAASRFFSISRVQRFLRLH